MRILFINDYERHGGAEHYIRDIMSELEEEHAVKLLTLAGEDSELNFSERGLFSYIEKFFSPIKSRKVKRKIRRFNPDIIHLHNIHKGTIPTLRALNKVDKPLIKTFHDYRYFCVCPYALHGEKLCEGVPERCFLEGEINFKQYLFRKPLHSLRLKYLSIFDRILTPSKDLNSLVENFTHAEVLPNFVDTKKFSPNLGVRGEELLFVGRVTEEKGIEVLIDALAETENSANIVGAGDIDKYRKMAEDRNADLDFKGYVEEKRLIQMYQEAECTIVPSVCRESFNLVGLESLACGTPVVASNIGGMQDYVEEGKNGYLFDVSSPKELRKKLNSLEHKEFGDKESLILKDEFKLVEHLEKLSKMYKEAKFNF